MTGIKLILNVNELFDSLQSVTVSQSLQMKFTILLIFGAIANVVNSILLVHIVDISQNVSLVKINIEYFNDNVHDTVINVKIETFALLNNIRLYIKVDVYKNRNDQFDTNLANTVIDVEKLFRGALANPIIRTVTESLLENANFKLHFPLNPVSFDKCNYSA